MGVVTRINGCSLFPSTEEAAKVLKSITEAIKGSRVTVRVEGGGDQEVPITPSIPTQLDQESVVCEVAKGEDCGVKVEDEGCGSKPVVTCQETKCPSPHKLPRQDKPIQESEGCEELADNVPPMHAEGMTPLEEGAPVRRVYMSRQGKTCFTGGQNKTLVSAPSEADSAVSLVTNEELCVYMCYWHCSFHCSFPVI